MYGRSAVKPPRRPRVHVECPSRFCRRTHRITVFQTVSVVPCNTSMPWRWSESDDSTNRQSSITNARRCFRSCVSFGTTRKDQTVSPLPCSQTAPLPRSPTCSPLPFLRLAPDRYVRPRVTSPAARGSSPVRNDLCSTDHVARRCYPPRHARHVPFSRRVKIAAVARPFWD